MKKKQGKGTRIKGEDKKVEKEEEGGQGRRGQIYREKEKDE